MIILTVLDFEDGRVYQYDIEVFQDGSKPELDADDFEKLLVEQGHSLDSIEWMSHSDNTLNKIKIEL